MTDLDRIRALAQGLIDEAAHIVDECGVAGGHREVARAEVARQLLSEIEALPPLTSPDRIPAAARQTLEDYRDHGLRPGHFLAAVLAGDLFRAMARADDEAMLALPAIVAYVASALPAGCHGSEDLVERWIRRPRS